MSTITANGKTFSIEESITVEAFLNQLEIKTKWVVVELNGEPLAREAFQQRTLQDNDQLEIVTPIAGG